MLAIQSAMYAACKLCKSHNSALFDAKSENPVEPKSKKTFRHQGSNVKETLDDEWVSSFLMAHQHIFGYLVPYDGEKVIKMWRYNQGYLAMINVK